MSAGVEGLSGPELWVCLLQAFALVGSPNALHISTCDKWQPCFHTWKQKPCREPAWSHDWSHTVTLDVSTKLLLKCFRALLASSSALKPTKPNFRNLPSLVNFREQSVTVPKAANMDLNLSSFICTQHTHTHGYVFKRTQTKCCWHPDGLLTPLGRFLTMSLDIVIVGVTSLIQHKFGFFTYMSTNERGWSSRSPCLVGGVYFFFFVALYGFRLTTFWCITATSWWGISVEQESYLCLLILIRKGKYL